MRFDLNEAMAGMGMDPWELAFTYDGQECRVRPLVAADVDRLRKIDRDTSNEKARELLAGLFEDPKPDVSGWGPDVVAHVGSAVAAYMESRLQKNCGRLARKIMVEALASPTGPGPTSPTK